MEVYNDLKSSVNQMGRAKLKHCLWTLNTEVAIQWAEKLRCIQGTKDTQSHLADASVNLKIED